MSAAGVATLPVRQPMVPNAVFGMMVFIVSEVMFFAGLISALTIVRSNSDLPWPPPEQARLPIEATAVNTLVLVASGVAVFAAWRAFARGERRARPLLLAGTLLGACFVFFQGMEWVALIGQGFTLTASTHSSFFYLIVGAHALHVLAALLVLSRASVLCRRERLEEPVLRATMLLWTFVVGVWPVLYVLVYLGGGA